MIINGEGQIPESIRRKGKLGKLLFKLSPSLLTGFVVLQAFLHIAVKWRTVAPMGPVAVPLFVIAFAIILANILFIHFGIEANCRKYGLSFEFSALNVALGSITTSAIALGYYLATAHVPLTALLDLMATMHLVYSAVRYKRQIWESS